MESYANLIEETLVTKCLSAYWDRSCGNYGISSNIRMAKVLEVIADEIRTWAPSESQARMNTQTIHEVADRIKEIATDAMV